MRKILLLVVMLSMVSAVAHADLKFRAQGSPAFSILTKYTEVPGVNVRDFNVGANFEASVEFWKGIGFGMDFLYMPGSFSIAGFPDGDLNMYGLTFGPRYYLPIAQNFEAYALANFGWYRSNGSLLGVSMQKDDWGMNFGVGLNYIYKNMTVGVKFAANYLANIGGGDDAMIYSLGPTIGVRF